MYMEETIMGKKSDAILIFTNDQNSTSPLSVYSSLAQEDAYVMLRNVASNCEKLPHLDSIIRPLELKTRDKRTEIWLSSDNMKTFQSCICSYYAPKDVLTILTSTADLLENISSSVRFFYVNEEEYE